MRGSGPELVWGAGQGLAEGDDQGNQERGSLRAVLVGPGPVTAWQVGLDAGDPVPPFGSSSPSASHPWEPAQVKVKQPACGPETTTFLHWLPVVGRAPAGTGRAGPHGAAPWAPPLWAGCHSQAHEVVQSALRSQFCKHPRVSRPLTTWPACKAWAPSAPGEGPGGARSPSRGGDRPAEQVVSLRAGQAWGNKQQTTPGGAPLPGSSSVLQVPLPRTQTQAQAGAWSGAAGLHSLGSGHLVGVLLRLLGLWDYLGHARGLPPALRTGPSPRRAP